MAKLNVGEEVTVQIVVGGETVYQKTGIVTESLLNATRFTFDNSRTITLPDNRNKLSLVHRLLKDGIKLGQ